MDQETQNKMAELEKKIDAIYASVEKTRKYFLWTLITTAVVLVLPMIGLLFAIPAFLSNYNSAIQTLGV